MGHSLREKIKRIKSKSSHPLELGTTRLQLANVSVSVYRWCLMTQELFSRSGMAHNSVLGCSGVGGGSREDEFVDAFYHKHARA